MKKFLFIQIKKLIILVLCINACETGRYGGKQTGERRERAFCRCFIYSGRRKVKGTGKMKSIMKKSLMAGMSVCMVLSMTPATAMAAGSENVLSGSEASGTPGAKETVMGYKLAPGWEIMGEDASHYTAQGTDSVSIDVQHGDLYYTNGGVRNTAKNVFLHTVEQSDFAISVKLDFKPGQDFQTAGLIIYRDEDANFAATRRYHSYFEDKSLCIQGVNTNSFPEGHMADPSQEQAPIWLRIVKEGTMVKSYYRLSEDDEWTEYDNREWSSFDGAEAEDLKVGLYTRNTNPNGSSTALFSDFSIQYGSEAPQETAIFEETEIEVPDERIEYITDRDWYSAEVGYGSPKKDTGVDGDAIVLGGRTYTRGLAAHADSRVVYDIEGLGVLRFQAVAGVNKSQGSCQFIVEADGKELVKTDILHGTDETQAIDVEIPEGTKMLTLITNTGGDNGNYDHSIWADAKFVMDSDVSLDSLRKITVSGPGYLSLDGEGELKVSGELVSGDAADLSGAEITYSSSDDEVLSVDQNGRMTGKKDGSADVTVTVTMGEAVKTEVFSVIVGEGDGEMWNISSPDESLRTLFLLDEEGEGHYFVLEDDKVVVDDSQLGIVTDAGDFTEGLTFKDQSEITKVTDEYDLMGAKVSHVKEEGREMTLSFAKDGAELDVTVRMYDDGMAFRYGVDSEDGGELAVSSEATTLTVPAGSTAYAMDYINHNEEIERVHQAEELGGDYCMPLLYSVDDTWCLVSEADLGPEYCGTYLKGDGTGSLNFHLSKEQSGDVTTELPFVSPWRFVVIGTAEEINLNTMAETLSPDRAEGDWSWVEPGVTAWTWLNRESTSDYETYRKYVDFAAEMGWQYLLLDEGWQPKGSAQGHSEYAYYGYYDWTEDLIDYANEKGIRLLVWANHNDLKDPAEREKRFAQWEEWGIAGVKPDFFNSSSQEYMQLYQDLIEETAEHRLLLNLHGLPKPAGERRTYPHLLTREGVFGHEQELFRPSDMSAFHNCMLPFMRNAVGPADYTPMFSYRNSNGQVRFSLAQMAAMPVVYESGIQCLADRPDEYIGSPAEFYFKSFPAAWDESHVLQAVPGDLVTIARRSGEDWYVGSMCNTQHDAVIDLSFLGDGEYYAVICKDGETQEEIVGEMQIVTKEDTLTIPMLETGGAALKILKEKPSEPDSITLDQTSLTLEQHDTAQLTAEITPEDTEMSQITWSSSDESVVTVKNGQVVAVAPGHAVITASTGFAGGVKAECEVEVKEPKYILTEDWEITNSDPVYWDLNDDGSVTIQTQIGEIYSGGKFTVKNLFLTPVAQQGDFTVNVKLDFAPEANYQTAGLILFQDVDNNFCVSRRYHTSFGGDILAYHGLNNAKWSENNSTTAVKITDEDQGPVSLQITKSGDVLTASYKWDGDSEWTQICQQTYTGLTGGLKVGLYVADAGNEDIQIPASFSDFTVQYAGEEPVQIAFSEKNPNAEPEEPEEPEELSTAVLEYALELAGKVSTENVMDAVAERFEEVKAEAQAVLDAAKAGDPSVTQKQIDDSWKALIDIMQHLSFEKVDKAALESVIKFAEEIEPNLDSYMETGKQEFTDALADARTVYEDELAMADEVEQAWTRLLKAAADLRLYADKDALENLVSEAEAIDLTAYTEESARAFTEALVSAKEVLADETLSEDDQSIVDKAAEALEAARGQLVAKADAEDPSGTTADPGQSSGEDGQNTADGQKTADKTAGTGSGSQTAVSGSKAVKTGDTASMAGYLLAAGAALAAAGTEVVRRKRTR